MKPDFIKTVIAGAIFTFIALVFLGLYSYSGIDNLISDFVTGSQSIERGRQLQNVLVWTCSAIAFAILVLFFFIYQGLQRVKIELSQKKEIDQKFIQSEKIYRSLSSNIPGSAITILDRDERYILAEGDLLEKMGYRKSEMPGIKIADIISAENYVYYKTLIDQAFAGETLFLEKRTLSGFDTLLRVVPLREGETIFAIMFVYIDVTELKHIQSELAQLNETLEKQVALRTQQLHELNLELESFSYSVSHDLRAPLRAILGFTQILEEDYNQKLDDEGRKVISVIVKNVSRMSQLIDDLLNFSKLGRAELTVRTVNMAALVTEIAHEHIAVEGDRKINLRLLPLESAVGDERLLRQVWINLISNALKYSQKKEVTEIEIGSYIENDFIRYYITDNGAGFDMQYIDKLFGVFQRLHKMDDFEGTGIGLALVKTIIKRHGGEIQAEGKVKEGAKFHFTLPAIDHITNQNPTDS